MNKQKEDKTNKDRLNLWLKPSTVIILKTKSAIDKKPIGQIVDELVEEKINNWNVSASITASEVVKEPKEKD